MISHVVYPWGKEPVCDCCRYNYDHYWLDFDDNDIKAALKHALWLLIFESHRICLYLSLKLFRGSI